MPYTETKVRVKSEDIAPDTIIAADIAAGGVGTSELADKAVTTAKGSPSFVDTDLIAANAVINTKISQFTQSGSAASVIAGAYVTPAKAYGDANYVVVLEPKEAAFDFLYVDHQVAGSFFALGSPAAQYFIWRTYGPGTTAV